MNNYQEMKKELEKNQEKLTLANNKSIELDNISNITLELVNNLKTTITSKDKYVLKQENTINRVLTCKEKIILQLLFSKLRNENKKVYRQFH